MSNPECLCNLCTLDKGKKPCEASGQCLICCASTNPAHWSYCAKKGNK